MTRETLLYNIWQETADPAGKLVLLDELLLDEVSNTTTGEPVYTLTKHNLTVFIKTVGETVNLNVTIQGSPNGEDWFTLGVIDNNGITKLAPLTFDSQKNSVFEIVNATTIKWVRAITTITTGTVTVFIQGRS